MTDLTTIQNDRRNGAIATGPACGDLRKSAIALVVSVVLGVGISFLRHLVFGNLDPFQEGRPAYLQSATFLSALVVSLVLRSYALPALGVYAGLVATMLMSGKSEYPVASCIALAIHGFLPALAGSGLVFAVRWRWKRRAQKRQNA